MAQAESDYILLSAASGDILAGMIAEYRRMGYSLFGPPFVMNEMGQQIMQKK